MARVASDAANKLDDEAKRATAQAVVKRRAADAAKTALARAQQSEQNLQRQAEAATKKLTEATDMKRGVGSVEQGAVRLQAPISPLPAPRSPLQAPSSSAAARRPGRRGAETDPGDGAEETGRRCLAERQEPGCCRHRGCGSSRKGGPGFRKGRRAKEPGGSPSGRQTQSGDGCRGRPGPGGQKLAEAESQKKANAPVLASVKTQVTAATAANQAAQFAAKDVIQLDTASKQATADAVAKHKAADVAKAALAPA